MKQCGILALLLSLCGAAYSQTTFASITGTVTDASGAAVANARLTATNLDNNIKSTVESSAAGNYTIGQLKEGAYSLTAQAAGFKEFVAQNIVLVARDVRRVDVMLEVGAVDTRIEVSGGATLIETETARISDTKAAQLMKTIPLNTRSIWAIS